MTIKFNEIKTFTIEEFTDEQKRILTAALNFAAGRITSWEKESLVTASEFLVTAGQLTIILDRLETAGII